MNKLLLITITLCLALNGCNEQPNDKQVNDMTTKYYLGLNLHKYGTHADWIEEESEIKIGYEDAKDRGRYVKVEYGKNGEVLLVEGWNQNFKDINEINFNYKNLDKESPLLFIKSEGSFIQIDYSKTEKSNEYYVYSKGLNLEKIEGYDPIPLKRIQRSILYKTEYSYDKERKLINICHYDINKDGKNVTMDDCKSIFPPRKLKKGELPYF